MEKKLKKLTIPILKEKCKAAGLPRSGTKAKLIDRLLNPVKFYAKKKKLSCDDVHSNTLYISCSLVYPLRFMYRICRFLLVKFQLPITFFLFGRFIWYLLGDIDKLCKFLTPTKKSVKFEIFEISQNFSKFTLWESL